MARRLFGTDGVRGRANAGNMSPEVAFRLGAALTHEARKRTKHAPRIVIGKDTRISGYLFEHALSAGICAMVDLHREGTLPASTIVAAGKMARISSTSCGAAA